LEGANNTLSLEQAATEGYSFYKLVSANQLPSIKSRLPAFSIAPPHNHGRKPAHHLHKLPGETLLGTIGGKRSTGTMNHMALRTDDHTNSV
jgi:hypothetical protein